MNASPAIVATTAAAPVAATASVPAIAPPASTNATFIQVEDLCVHYGTQPVLKSICLPVPAHQVTAFIGPSGGGKSTLLRCFNRMNELAPHARTRGRITIGGQEIYHPDVDVIELRRRVGLVFQRANPFAKSIFENVAYGLRMQGVRSRFELDLAVEKSLQEAALWDEVKDRLHTNALQLSGGQQQRLCIARAIALRPEVLLMDEPTATLDPMATARIEDLIHELKQTFTILIVTHNMPQATRISDQTAFLHLGELIEFGATARLFNAPKNPQTEAYVTGRFG